jgi:transposase-like protein
MGSSLVIEVDNDIFFLRECEAYIKIRGVWTDLYRAVDREGRTVDFRLCPRRDVTAAKLFFRKR